MEDDRMGDRDPSESHQQHQSNGDSGGEVIGSSALRPVFLGNLNHTFTAADVIEIFERPIVPPDLPPDAYDPIPVDRVDLKRGYCFVFLKDAATQADKERAERFVSDLNGMSVPNVSSALRVEFARGDGRVKRKEDDRRRNISPSETLFVVNFHEERTKREDLQMLFEPFGELVRIDMKKNYAFVQFRTIEEASRAKEVTNGGKLDQSVLTVEFVANQRGDRDSGGGGGGGRRRGDDYRDRRGPPPPRGGGAYDDRRGPPPPRGLPPPLPGRGGGDRDRYNDDRYRRDRSPPRWGGGGGRRSGSRSRSPPVRYRSRSPERFDRRGGSSGGGGGGGRYDDYRRSPDNYRGGRGYEDRRRDDRFRGRSP